MSNPICPYCGGNSHFIDSYELCRDHGPLYICENYPHCDAYVGVHTKTGRPLGTLANRKLRKLRMRLHRKFDFLWQSRRLARTQAYYELAQALDLPCEKAHIGKLNEDQCRAGIKIAQKLIKKHIR